MVAFHLSEYPEVKVLSKEDNPKFSIANSALIIQHYEFSIADSVSRNLAKLSTKVQKSDLIGEKRGYVNHFLSLLDPGKVT